MQGQEFTKEDIKSLLEQDLKANEIKAHPVWKALARDDALLTEYTDKMFAEMKARFTYDTAMGLYLASGEKVPTLRAAFVNGLGNWSQFVGRYDLDDDDWRLVGVAPEALNALGKAIERPSLETVLHLANQYLGQGEIELHKR